MKHLTLLLIASLAALLSGCTAIKAVRCGAPSVDTYTRFPLDTISAADTVKTVFISTPDHDRYFENTVFSGGQFNNETLADYFSRARGDGALLIVRNDTILLEKYYGDFAQLSPSNIFSLTKAVSSLLCGIAVDEVSSPPPPPLQNISPNLKRPTRCSGNSP